MGMVGFVCLSCKHQEHERCPGGCDCQHRDDVQVPQSCQHRVGEHE